MTYVPVIGLEVHLQLKTNSKIFCGCATRFAAAPNSQVCPVCLGFPGVLPVLNRKTFRFGVRVALSLSCTIQDTLIFHRKNYFYPDLPKGYQISQYDLPLARNGFVELKVGRKIRVHRVHMEEDAGKLLHREGEAGSGGFSLVDFNRAGIPLLEIVSEPDITSAEEAHEYLKALKGILEYLDVSDCDMEKGTLRCDANVSLSPPSPIEGEKDGMRGERKLGTKVEIKNLNSFKAVAQALRYEMVRQEEALSRGEKISQETRLWDDAKGVTLPMRSKEYAHDYRYFPEPDLVPFHVPVAEVEEVRRGLPELPQVKAVRFAESFKLPAADARLLTVEKTTADYFEACVKGAPAAGKTIANWILGELAREMNEKNLTDIGALQFPPAHLLELIGLVEQGTISHKMAKEVFTESLATRQLPKAIVQTKHLSQVTDRAALEAVGRAVIERNPAAAADFQKGKGQALMFLVGHMMRETKGAASPALSQEILRQLLEERKG